MPDALERLEAQARRLRESGDTARGERLGLTLAAMEQLRLDLLRLRTSATPSSDLTGDLEAARRVTDRIEALLQAQRELESPTPAPGV